MTHSSRPQALSSSHATRTLRPRDPRPSFETAVVLIAHDGTARHGTTMNVSAGGMMVATDAKLAVGDPIRARFRLPTLSADTEADAIVRWTSEARVGLSFTGLRAIEVRAIHRMLR